MTSERAKRIRLGEGERHAIDHAEYLVARAAPDRPGSMFRLHAHQNPASSDPSLAPRRCMNCDTEE